VDGEPSMPDNTQAEHEPVTIGLVAHYAFGPRRAWLEAAGERTDTAQMAVGSAAHRLTSGPTTQSLPGPARAARSMS